MPLTLPRMLMYERRRDRRSTIDYVKLCSSDGTCGPIGAAAAYMCQDASGQPGQCDGTSIVCPAFPMPDAGPPDGGGQPGCSCQLGQGAQGAPGLFAFLFGFVLFGRRVGARRRQPAKQNGVKPPPAPKAP